MATDNGEATLTVSSITVEVERMQRLLDTGSCKAFCKVRFKTSAGSITIDNFRIVSNKDGELFVAPPSHKKGERFYDDVEVTEDLKKYLNGAVLKRYQQEIKQ